jgi:hypothetical protein
MHSLTMQRAGKATAFLARSGHPNSSSGIAAVDVVVGDQPGMRSARAKNSSAGAPRRRSRRTRS